MRARGFTLLEVLLAAMLASLAVLATYGMYAGAARLQERVDARARARRAAMDVYRQVERDLRFAWPFGTPPKPEGTDAESISAAYEAARARAFTLDSSGSSASWWTLDFSGKAADLVFVQWRLAGDGRLWRTAIPYRTWVADAAAPPEPEEMAADVADFRIVAEPGPNGELPREAAVQVELVTRVRSDVWTERFEWVVPLMLFRQAAP
jgi:prepilin-type N-terminal cleavage/methylation domain-containing protein